MCTHNIGFYGEISKFIPKSSSNTHLIYSFGNVSNVSFFVQYKEREHKIHDSSNLKDTILLKTEI